MPENKVNSVDRRPAVLQPGNGLLNGDDIGRQLGNDALQNGLVDARRVRRRLDRIVGDHISAHQSVSPFFSGMIPPRHFLDSHIVVQIKQMRHRSKHHPRRPNPTDNHRINLLRSQNLLQRISRPGIIPRLLQHHVPGRVIRLERRVQERIRITRGPQRAGHLRERRVPQLGLAGVAEVDAREDGEGRGGLAVNDVDPAGGVEDEGLAGGGVGEGADEGVD